MNKKERRLAFATALQSATGSTTIIEDIKVLLARVDIMRMLYSNMLACCQSSSTCKLHKLPYIVLHSGTGEVCNGAVSVDTSASVI